jgi:hypothetical protein
MKSLTLTTASIILTLFSSAELCADDNDYGKASLKGIKTLKVDKVTFDTEAQIRLTSTTDQFQAKIIDFFQNQKDIVLQQNADATLSVAIRLGQPVTLPVLCPNNMQVNVTFWMYRVDTKIIQTVTINRALPLLPLTLQVPTWRMIGGGILISNFDEGLRKVLIENHLKQFMSDYKEVNK